ncbi:solute carrier family 25 member 40 [Diplodia corticola]|uniref:Solute carrier family 25 member 40 n=1 Tax=Diplodia corticola TaxID=236234 RepID=A0A1J9R615_9PEZI|nr:solute carrier family 25 member 40 [Diplodia corticola]OJD35993.1 solute carrier family 25 member 40 [Diplodia corticola]
MADTADAAATSARGQPHDRLSSNSDSRTLHTMAKPPSSQADPPDDISVSQKMLSAVTGSILTSLLVTPLDVVRVRLQSQHHSTPTSTATTRRTIPTLSTLQLHNARFTNIPPNLGITACCREVFWVNNNASYCVAGPTVMPTITPTSAASCAVEETQRKAFTSTFDGLRKIARNEGIRTLWRGLSPTLVMTVPANVIYFAGYDWLRTASTSPVKNNFGDSTAPLVAGSTARVLAAIAVSPIEMFRTRMQATHSPSSASGSHFRDTLKGMGDLVRQDGWISLWRGLGLTLWRDVPFSAIYWWGYESTRNVITDERERMRGRGLERGRASGAVRARSRSRSRSEEDHTETLVDSFVAGATSGAVAAFVTTPFDVGKTRQQTVRHSGSKGSAGGVVNAIRPEERSIPRFLLHIFQEQGLPGLFRGWSARCLKVAPACAIMISTYEMGKKMAGTVNERRH